jgi:hypothetical protein
VASERAPLTLFFESFAFKLGVPMDADFVFDVRALPNPYYDLTLRPLTGRDAPVIDFLDAQPSALEMLSDIRAFVEKVAAIVQDRQPQLPDGGPGLHRRPAPFGLHGGKTGSLLPHHRTRRPAPPRAVTARQRRLDHD